MNKKKKRPQRDSLDVLVDGMILGAMAGLISGMLQLLPLENAKNGPRSLAQVLPKKAKPRKVVKARIVKVE